MEYSEKPKAIIFVRTDFCPMPKYIELIESLDISSILEVKYVYSDPEKFNPEPFPLTEKVEILGLFGMTGLELEIIKRYKSIKWIHAFPAGIEKLIEKEEIKNFKGIFTNGRGAYKIQIAEFVSFGILWFCNNCEFWMRKKEEKEYAKYAVESISLNQKTLGIFGFGDIGLSCAKIAKRGYNMKVLGMKKNLEGITKEMNEFSDSILTSEDPSNIDFILENSDFIVNCSPLTVETNQFFDLEKFKKMKKSACFINVGRGQSVKEQDLIKAVEEKEISGAVLDVFEEEPLPLDSPLWDFDNVFITPHSCELTQDSILARLEVFVENAKKFILDQNLDYVVDFEKGY